ncbi:hypothetical protein KQI38_02960 [Tissierella carlieri]|uniref:hypothetical protein n=1 Tax=Tissierella carlieri TaxID=689904 RepID=UPI001C116289|nr:hypothetical protein [Tissierella carlieri]MBU5310975.1 hypothetical protein [Tissierella carlieri]
MGFFDRFRRNTNSMEEEENIESINSNISNEIFDNSVLDLLLEVSDEEKELVSLIASVIASGDHLDAKFKVTSIKGIDIDKEIAAAIVSAIAAGDNQNSNFRLKSITQIK